MKLQWVLWLGIIGSLAGCATGTKTSSAVRQPSSTQDLTEKNDIKAFRSAQNSIQHHDLERLEKIFSEHPFSQEDKDALLVHDSIRSSSPPLFSGTDKSESQDALNVIAFLINQEANINSLPAYNQPKEGFSGPIQLHALNVAVENESFIMVKFLLEHGADPNGTFCYEPNQRPYAADDGEQQPLLHGTALDQAVDFASHLDSFEGYEDDAKRMHKIASLIKTSGGHTGDGLTGEFNNCDQIYN